MSKDSEITSFPSGLSPAVLKASSTLKLAGNVGFWLQLVFGVFAAVILLFASASILGDQKAGQGNVFGLLCATGGVLTLVVSIICFFRCRKIAQLMQDRDAVSRPKKAYTLQVINFGLIANLAGMFLAIIGAEALVGLLLNKFLNLPQGAVASAIDPKDLLKAGEIMIILANTHTILCHFVGIVIALWLLNQIDR
jgi:Protein of unknown function (DUF3611)